jgi:hypothetical protein
MRLVALPVDSTTSKQVLDSMTEDGHEAMEAESCTILTHGDTITPAAGVCYDLTFNVSRWETTFPIDATATTAIAFFAQHLPTEFEKDTHYLKLVVSGEDIESIAEEVADHGDSEAMPWDKVIGASIIINLATLSGLVFAIPFVSPVLKKSNPTFIYAGFASFAAGAILSCAFFLLLFESTHLVSSGWDNETDHIWTFLGSYDSSWLVATCCG